MKFLFATVMLVALNFSVWSLETDNYLSWTVELEDTSETINTYINDEIQKTLNEVNQKKKPISCYDLTIKIAKRFKTKPPVTHPLEDYLAANLTESMIYPLDKSYRLRSVYQNPFRFYLKYVKLAPSIQINGYYLGTDKLSHFVSTGRRLYHYYHKQLRKGLNPEEALKKAIRFGLWNEKTFLGTWSSGVFSYADVEANYQGFLFYEKMCNETDSSLKETYLTKTAEDKWQQVVPFDIRPYASPYWDESFNPSYRLKRNWKKTSKMLKKNYCPLFNSPLVQQRWDYYQSWQGESFSLNYVQELIDLGHKLTPDPLKDQSFAELCGF